MFDEDLTFICALLVAALLGGLLGLGGCHETEVTNRAAISAGLVQKKQDGSLIWTRP